MPVGAVAAMAFVEISNRAARTNEVLLTIFDTATKSIQPCHFLKGRSNLQICEFYHATTWEHRDLRCLCCDDGLRDRECVGRWKVFTRKPIKFGQDKALVFHGRHIHYRHVESSWLYEYVFRWMVRIDASVQAHSWFLHLNQPKVLYWFTYNLYNINYNYRCQRFDYKWKFKIFGVSRPPKCCLNTSSLMLLSFKSESWFRKSKSNFHAHIWMCFCSEM